MPYQYIPWPLGLDTVWCESPPLPCEGLIYCAGAIIWRSGHPSLFLALLVDPTWLTCDTPQMLRRPRAETKRSGIKKLLDARNAELTAYTGSVRRPPGNRFWERLQVNASMRHRATRLHIYFGFVLFCFVLFWTRLSCLSSLWPLRKRGRSLRQCHCSGMKNGLLSTQCA